MIYRDLKISTVIAGSKECPRHSEASILELNDGSLLMAWQCHQHSDFGSGDLAPATISLMNSYDKGATWVNQRVAAKMIEGCVNCYSPSLFRRKDGSISLFFKRYTHLVPGEHIFCNYYRIDSTNEGATWSEEYTLWENKEYYPINDALKRMADGSVLMPIQFNEGSWCGPDDHNVVSVLLSDDDCITWTQSNQITLPMRGAEEPCVAQMSDGSVNMVLRNQLGSVFYSESFDGGKNWSKPQTTGLRAPESCPCIFSIPNTDAQLVVWNNSEYDMNWRSHYGKRTPLTIALSRDGLKTFSDVYDIETDPTRAFTNPALTVTKDGLFLLTYWTCPYYPDGLMGNGYIDLKLATFYIDL